MELSMTKEGTGERSRLAIVILITVVCVALTYYFEATQGSGSLFTHFFYIPIVLSAFWWRQRGLIVPIILGFFMIAGRNCCVPGTLSTFDDSIRIFTFGLTAIIVALLSQRIHRTEGKLQESEARYRSMFENMNEGVAVYKALEGGNDFVVLDVNRAAEKIDHVRKEGIVGRSFSELYPESTENDLLGGLKRVWTTGEPETGGHCLCRDQGRSRWKQCSIYKLPSDELVSVYCDRTEQKRAEEKALQLASIVESSDDAIISMTPEGIILSWNAGAQKVYGYSSQQMNGQSILVLAAPDRKEEMLENLVKTRNGEELGHFETSHLHKDGRRIDVALTISPLKNLQGTIIGASMIARNIMRRKKAERALQKAYEELEVRVEERTRELEAANHALRKEIEERERMEDALRQSSEKIKQFAYLICHDLKSPAVGIYGLTTLLRNQYGDFLDEQGQKYCEQIVKASEQIDALVKQINVYISTKESPLSIEHLEVKELFGTVRDEFSAEIGTRGILWIEADTPAKVRADRLSLVRVFRNLVDNALKYGGPQLSEIRLGYDESEGFHIFFVRDNGVGLTMEHSHRIFELFQRDSTSRGVEGAGMGLAIVKEAAERHGGKVWVESRHGTGTTFFVSIAKDLG